MEIRTYLEQLGLDSKEIAVYLATLDLGETHIIPIVKKVGLPRTTVFHILERLNSHKLVEIIEKGQRHLYSPYPPGHIITVLKEQKVRIDEKIDSAEEALPELMRLYNISPFQPKVRFYQGKDIRRIYEEILDIGEKENWYVGESKMIVETLGERYMRGWIKRRIEKGIHSRSIRVKSEEAEEEIFGGRRKFMRSIRYAPADFRSPTHILIYGDNVALITTAKESFGVVITSKEYVETMRNWFEQLWKVSGEK